MNAASSTAPFFFLIDEDCHSNICTDHPMRGRITLRLVSIYAYTCRYSFCAVRNQKKNCCLLLNVFMKLCCLEKTANYYDPASELAVVNRTASVSPVVLTVNFMQWLICVWNITRKHRDASM